MITYLRMSSAWHKGDGPARVRRSLAGDGEVAAGGHGLPDVPGHAFGLAPPPVDQQHDGGQARTVNTTYTESAFLRGRKRSPARQPGEREIGDRHRSGKPPPFTERYRPHLGPWHSAGPAGRVKGVALDGVGGHAHAATRMMPIAASPRPARWTQRSRSPRTALASSTVMPG